MAKKSAKNQKSTRIIRTVAPPKAELERMEADRKREMEANGAPMPVPGTLGAKYAEARKAKKLTYYAVARLAGLPSHKTVWEIEMGSNVRLASLLAVAKALDLKLELVKAG